MLASTLRRTLRSIRLNTVRRRSRALRPQTSLRSLRKRLRGTLAFRRSTSGFCRPGIRRNRPGAGLRIPRAGAASCPAIATSRDDASRRTRRRKYRSAKASGDNPPRHRHSHYCENTKCVDPHGEEPAEAQRRRASRTMRPHPSRRALRALLRMRRE